MYMGAADMRKGFDGLSGLVRDHMGKDPLDGSVYIFVNRRRDRIKLLVWDRTGLALYYKRLEAGTFELPSQHSSGGGITVEWEVLLLMLEGISLRHIKRRKRYKKGEKILG
jgi:transposase